MKGKCAVITNKQEVLKDVCFCKDNVHVGDYLNIQVDTAKLQIKH